MILARYKNIDRYAGNIICAALGALAYVKRIFSRNAPPHRRPRKILLIKFWGLGNTVLLLPVFKAVGEYFKEAEIDILTLKTNENILEAQEDLLNSLHIIDTRDIISFMRSIVFLLRRIRKSNYDLLIDFEIYTRFSTILSFLSKAGFTIGIAPERIRSRLYDAAVSYSKETHITKTYADLIKIVGIELNEIKPIKVIVTKDDELSVDEFFHKNGIRHHDALVGMHIGSGDNFKGRRWSKENFTELARALIEEFNCKIIFTGLLTEQAMIKDAVSMIPQAKNVVNAAGCVTTRELAYLLSKISLLICNDTGPLHIASCMGTPVIGLYGPNTPDIYGPIGDNAVVFYKRFHCSPCITNLNSKTSYCRDYKCMNVITVEEVYGEVKKFFSDRSIAQPVSHA